MYEVTGKKIFVAGHKGMVGSAVCQKLSAQGAQVLVADRGELDLTNQGQVSQWMAQKKPQGVVLAAAKVGGIYANDTYPADFLYQNLMIEANVIHSAYENAVEKLLFLGSSCIYPKLAPQPMQEGCLLTSDLEPTNQWYAIAKIAGLKMCEAYHKQYGCNFISAMPTNLYGPGDTYSLKNSHVIPAMILKIHQAKVETQESVEIWGTGEPLREFLYIEDLADALVYIFQNFEGNPLTGERHINVGTAQEVSIKELSQIIAQVVGYEGDFYFNSAYPNGTPRKLLDTSALNTLGWEPQHSLVQGLEKTYQAFLDGAGRFDS